jgi:hypothetical protein
MRDLSVRPPLAVGRVTACHIASIVEREQAPNGSSPVCPQDIRKADLCASIASPRGGGAAYTCSGDDGGTYAQCDGGICFRSTEEASFPGFDKPVPKSLVVRASTNLPGLQRAKRRRIRFIAIALREADDRFGSKAAV